MSFIIYLNDFECLSNKVKEKGDQHIPQYYPR